MIRMILVILFLGVGSVQPSYCHEDLISTIPPYKISSIKGFLYYSNSGSFSENIIDNNKIPLWNIVIEGSVPGGPSDSMMIVVELSGGKGTYTSRKIDFLATADNGRVLEHKILKIGILSDKGKHFKAVWLDDIGCEAVTISIKITEQSPVPEVKKRIDFECGE